MNDMSERDMIMNGYTSNKLRDIKTKIQSCDIGMNCMIYVHIISCISTYALSYKLTFPVSF